MSNDNHPISYSSFCKLTDNVVKPHTTSWGELVRLFTTHIIATDEKACLPAINGWQFIAKGDPAEVMGLRPDGEPYKNFSPTGVRRIQENLAAMSMFIFDFDGKIQLSEVQSIFGQYEYACYTSLNHQVANIAKQEPAVDKMRVIVPMANPMPVEKFQELRTAMHYWIDSDGPRITDPATFHIGQIFLLPAVREEDRSKAVAWRNEGELLDWRMFEAIKKSMPVKAAIQYGAFGRKPSEFVLKPDDVLDTANGSIAVRNIDRKISYVLCPFHGDRKPSEFAGITTNGTPFLQCKKCGRIYMDRAGEDPIIAGLAKVAEKKRRCAAQEIK